MGRKRLKKTRAFIDVLGPVSSWQGRSTGSSSIEERSSGYHLVE